MDIRRLKDHIIANDKTYLVLEELGCHHIKFKGNYYTCGNPDGDNVAAITVYLNENITVVNYTRDITGNKNVSDIFSLVEFFRDCTFSESVKIICEWIGIDYYYDFDENLPQSLKLTQLILEMQAGGDVEEREKPLVPISEDILTYYDPYVNDMFAKDGIDYSTQRIFEVGYDQETNRITIPIRDELGALIGVKGRLFKNEVGEDELKYMYIEKCARSKILYGLNLTGKSIKAAGFCYVGESEKSVQQMWSIGVYNCVATGGKKVSTQQIEKLTRLCVDLVFLFDKDVEQEELEELADRFVDGVNIYAVIDKDGILESKESPTDSKDKFLLLIKNNKYKIR